MLTIFIVFAIVCAGLAVYFWKKNVFQFTIFFIMWSLFWGAAALCYFAENKKTAEKDYTITLKLLQSNTVVHGNLENFLINDNE